jgi:hypothetical protein
MRDETWDLLLDFDRSQDVPGAATPRAWEVLNRTSGERRAILTNPDSPKLYAKRYDVVPLIGAPVDPDWKVAESILTRRCYRAGFVVMEFEHTGSTNGWHVKMRVHPRPDPVAAVALQAILGSDPLRESCNLQRARALDEWTKKPTPGGAFWGPRWNVLYLPNPKRVRKP